jgi:hypothetical protein
MSLVDSLDVILHDWEKYQDQYPAHVKVEKLEIVQGSSNDPVCKEEEIDVSDRGALAQWLEGDEDSTPKLKLLLICTQNVHQATYKSNEEDTKAVTEAFRAARLPLTGLISYSTNMTSSAKAPSRYFGKDGKTSLLSRYYFTAINSCITWAYDHSTKNTRAALVYCQDRDDRVHFVKALTSNAIYIDQPMLLGLLGSKICLHRIEKYNESCYDKMWSIRDSIGLFNWDPETDNLVQVDSRELNCGTISQELGSLLARVNG